MNPGTILKTIEIGASAEEVWKFIGNGTGLSCWWGVDVTMEERQGGQVTESGLRNGQPYRRVGQVTVYNAPLQLSLRLQEIEIDESWPSLTELDILLEENQPDGCERQTTVSITHRAIVGPIDTISSAIGSSLTTAGPLSTVGPTMMQPRNSYAGGHADEKALSNLTAASNGRNATAILYKWHFQQEATWDGLGSDLAKMVGQSAC